MKNRRKIIYNGIKIFLLSFILFSLGIKIGGLHPKEINPLTWQEFFGHIGNICILSICFSVLYILLGRKIEKIIKIQQERDHEAACRRIAERDKEGVRSKTLVDEIVKDVMKNSKQEEDTSEKE